MNIVLDASAGNGSFGQTATAGTAIVVPIPPVVNHYTRLLQLNYTPSGTSHNISVLKPVGTATVNGGAVRQCGDNGAQHRAGIGESERCDAGGNPAE